MSQNLVYITHRIDLAFVELLAKIVVVVHDLLPIKDISPYNVCVSEVLIQLVLRLTNVIVKEYIFGAEIANLRSSNALRDFFVVPEILPSSATLQTSIPGVDTICNSHFLKK